MAVTRSRYTPPDHTYQSRHPKPPSRPSRTGPYQSRLKHQTYRRSGRNVHKGQQGRRRRPMNVRNGMRRAVGQPTRTGPRGRSRGDYRRRWRLNKPKAQHSLSIWSLERSHNPDPTTFRDAPHPNTASPAICGQKAKETLKDPGRSAQLLPNQRTQ